MTTRAVLLAAKLLLALAATATAATLAGCSKKQESIVIVGGDKKLSAEEIDADPLALLPGGVIILAQADAQAFLASQTGPSALRVAQNLVPLTPEMNFQPTRDLKTIVAGVYSMSGADLAAIAQGTFDVPAIKRAAERGAVTAMGQQLRKVEYAGNELYLSGDLGFVPLTSKTMLIGNPTGLRRALDRIRDGRVKREVPDWMVDLMKTPNAQAMLAADLQSQSVPAAATAQAPFLQGLSKARVVGNFQSPGMNFAGALTYGDAAGATGGEAQLKRIHSQASLLNMFAFFGVSSPIKSLDTRVQGNDVQFVAAVDGPVLMALMNQLGVATMFTGAMSAASPASSAR